jgi:hypothetical protein
MSPGSGSIFSTYMPKRFEEDREHKKFFLLQVPTEFKHRQKNIKYREKEYQSKTKIRNIVSSTEGGSSRKVGKSTNTVISNIPT